MFIGTPIASAAFLAAAMAASAWVWVMLMVIVP
jgi:hypothetical protein